MTAHDCSYRLPPLREALAGGIVEWHDRLPSTNDRALQLALDASLQLPALVLAEEQTSGRGRGRNRWWSARGAMLASLVIEPRAYGLETAQWPQISLAIALALGSAVDRRLGTGRCGLRWPNDLFLGERKLGGILVEAPAQSGAGGRRVVVGWGLNVNNPWSAAPHELRHVGTSLIDHRNEASDLTEIVLALLHGIPRELRRLASRDPGQVGDWQRRCLLTGRRVEIQCGQRQVAGACRGIDASGALLLQVGDQVERFHAGVLTAVSAPEPASETR